MDFEKKPLGTQTRIPVTEPEAVPPTDPERPVVEKKYPRKRILLWRIIVTTLLVIATGLLVAGWFYIQNLYAQLDSKDVANSHLTINTNMPMLMGQAPAGKDFVPQTQIESAALDTVEAFMSTKGVTRVQYEASIPYMDDNFARVRVDYVSPDPVTAKNKPTGKGEVFYFKRVERVAGVESWAMIANNPMTADEITIMKNRYGVTDGVINGSKPQ